MDKRKIDNALAAISALPAIMPEYIFVGEEAAKDLGLPGPGWWHLNKKTNTIEPWEGDDA